MNVIKRGDRFGGRAGFLLISLFAVIAVSVSRLHAESTDFALRLQKAVEQAESELKAEKTRIEKEKRAGEDELREIRETSKDLADRIVERRISIARKQAELRKLRKQREKLWAEHTTWQDDLSHLSLLCEEMTRDLRELLKAAPISEGRGAQLSRLADFKKSLVEDEPEKMVQSVLGATALLLRETRNTAVYPAEILDPRGTRRQVQLVRVGQNLFAYRIPETSQVAIAVADPYSEGGYRWHEGLDEPMSQAILDAISRGKNRRGVYPLPIDVTGTMSAATNLADKTLIGRIRSGGVVMFPLAAVAICLALLVLERIVVLLLEARHSLRFCKRALQMCGKGDFKQAEELAGRTRGILSRTLRVCLSHRHSPPDVLDDAIQETFLHEFPKLERFLPSIRMLSAVAPILGLLGTVTGIIATFDMITVVGGGKPRLLAGGISEALITTATGLIIAIPGLLAHSFLSGRINGIIAEAERFAASVSNLIKRKNNPGNDRDNGSNEDDTAD